MSSILLNYWQIGFGYLLLYMTPYYFELFLAALYIFQIRYYIILGEKEITRKVLKVLEHETRTTSCKYLNGKDIPSGYFFSVNCIGYIDNKKNYESEDIIYILTTIDYYKKLIKQNTIEMTHLLQNSTLEEKEKETRTKITVFNRTGQYTNLYYRPIQLDITHIQPIGDQKEIVELITNLFRTKGRASVFLHGVSCAGKSSIGYLVAKAIKGSFCHTFNPSDPGDSFSNMIDEIRSRDDEIPIVIVLEEVNVLIRNIHRKAIMTNPKIPTAVRDKATWSTMLDDMIFYKNIVFILTSNESKEILDELDVSYLRKGRIDASYEMLNQISLESI
jgi:hypothetical protein